MTSDWAQMGMANVSARVRELGEALEVVAARLPALDDAVAEIGEDVDRLIAERSETGAALSRHDRELRELAATVKRLSTQVTWIERHIRSTGSAPSIDLDHVDPELSALAATTEAGRRAADGLLPPFDRAGFETTVADHRDAVARRDDAVRSLLDACARLVDTEREDAGHRQARADYLRARSFHADAGRRLDVLGGEARAASERLAADDEERLRVAPTVAAGERAETELLTRLRTKLAAAVGDGALLPAWLTGPLGPMPPAGTAQRWMDVAAGLLAYRITYDVTDPEDALGELPDPVPGYRRRRHADLGRGIRELRR